MSMKQLLETMNSTESLEWITHHNSSLTKKNKWLSSNLHIVAIICGNWYESLGKDEWIMWTQYVKLHNWAVVNTLWKVAEEFV